MACNYGYFVIIVIIIMVMIAVMVIVMIMAMVSWVCAPLGYRTAFNLSSPFPRLTMPSSRSDTVRKFPDRENARKVSVLAETLFFYCSTGLVVNCIKAKSNWVIKSSLNFTIMANSFK